MPRAPTATSRVAQFEALKVAWDYKYQYNRPSPSKVDGSIQALMPTGDLPAYPSEDAVLSGVSAEMLKLLFPAAVEEITRKAGEQREAALLSGRASASDIAAGLALGQAVAAVFAARAGSDGMGAAVGTPAQWQALANAATARGEIPWQSLETPPRPPMLPNFGLVRAWMMTPTDITKRAARPATVDVVGPDDGGGRRGQGYGRRASPAISSPSRYKWNDGAGTYTPPGHWNDIATEYVSDAHWTEVRAARAFALLNMAMHDAAVGCWDAKYAYFNPAPLADRPEHQDVDRASELPVVHLGTFDVLGRGGRGAVVPLPERSVELRGHEGRSRDLPALRRHPLPLRTSTTGKDHGQRIGAYTVTFARGDGAD